MTNTQLSLLKNYVNIQSAKNWSILLLILFSFTSKSSFSQVDSIFWFAAPEISEHTSNFDKPIIIRITTLDKSAKVVITQPANPSFVQITVNIPASSTKSVDLTSYINNIETRPSNEILKTGLLIKSDNYITAYYEVASQQCNCNPEIFSLKGGNALGELFYIPTQMTYENSTRYSPQATSSFDIVSTQDNNQITITPNKSIVGHAKDISFSITLNKGETYSAVATSRLGSGHLAGSKVQATYPIAITVKDDLLEGLGQCRDVAGDQIVSINNIGLEYIAVKGFLDGNRELATIVATEPNTKIFIGSSVVPSAILNEGQYYEFNLTQNSTYIRSSKPIYVWHTSGFGCELAGAILPPVNCTGTFSTSVVRSTPDQLGIVLFTSKAGINSFTNNRGLTINSTTFTSVPGTNNRWYAARIELTQSQISAGEVLNISNPSHLFHLGFINGVAGSGTRYGYFSDYRKVTGTIENIIECNQSEIVLQHKKGNLDQWSTGSTIDSIMLQKSGTYWVNYTINNCPASDTFHVSITKNNSLNFIDTVLCKGEVLKLDLTNSELLLDSNKLQVIDNKIVAEGFYFRTVKNCPNVDSFYVYQSKIDLDLGPDSTFCDSIELVLSLSDFVSYQWSTGSDSSSTVLISEGTFSVIVEDEFSCKESDTIKIIKGVVPKVNLGQDTTLCKSSTAFLDAGHFAKYQWSNGSNKRYSPLNQFGEIWVMVTNDDGCLAADTILISESTKTNFDELLIPNSFSPDQNNLNENFPFYKSIIEVEDFTLKIYNLWGQQIFESHSPLNNWNGTFQNEPSALGTYIYTISWKDCSNRIKNKKGAFHLLR
ncbi:MAG: hypothetical protein COA58_11785 [Bacteroidetes bacterium]|nr:MAG: hypothetical protein COA58_11785 [Bacteroidota bacterium]